jgi:hypothetical protein
LLLGDGHSRKTPVALILPCCRSHWRCRFMLPFAGQGHDVKCLRMRFPVIRFFSYAIWQIIKSEILKCFF